MKVASTRYGKREFFHDLSENFTLNPFGRIKSFYELSKKGKETIYTKNALHTCPSAVADKNWNLLGAHITIANLHEDIQSKLPKWYSWFLPKNFKKELEPLIDERNNLAEQFYKEFTEKSYLEAQEREEGLENWVKKTLYPYNN